MKNTKQARRGAEGVFNPDESGGFTVDVIDSRRNRALSAQTDREAVAAWLARFIDSPNTLANARRESERLLLWAMIEAKKPLSVLTHEDFVRYRIFLANPSPAENWIMPAGRKLPRSHPQWRPFHGPLSPSSVRLSMTIVNSLFTWLVEAGHLSTNPLVLSRRRGFTPKPKVVRFLDWESWAAVQTTILSMPENSAKEVAAKRRLRWIISLLFLCGLRISEAVSGLMGDFRFEDRHDGEPIWWLSVTGKGGKTRLVPASSELMDELALYRLANGLPARPTEGESTPLILPLVKTSEGKSLTRAAVHQLVKEVFLAAARHVESSGGPSERARKLRSASAHWLRHTAGSIMAKSADLSHVRDTLGHVSLTTTNVYLHVEDFERHHSIVTSLRLDWKD